MKQFKRYRYYIGIDSGTSTGYAIWDSKERHLMLVDSMKIHVAMANIQMLEREYLDQTLIRVEDARQRTWFGNSGREKLQGAGSVKRDAVIWQDFLTDLKANFQMVPPKNNKTKVNAELFKKLTGWQHKTNEHARDAAMLVFNQ
jgi:hypothetical protein